MRQPHAREQVITTERPQSRDFSQLRFFYPFLTPYRGLLCLASLSVLIAGLMVLALGYGVRFLIDQGFGQTDDHHLTFIISGLVACVVIMAFASFGRSYLAAWIGERIAGDIQSTLYKHLLTLDVGFFEFTRPGELLTRLTTDVTLIHMLFSNSAAVAIRNAMLFGGGLTMMILTSPRLTILSLTVVPMVLIPIILFGKKVRFLSRQAQDRLSDVGGFLEETLGALHTTQAFTHEAADTQRFNQHRDAAVHAARRRLLTKAFLSSLVMILVFTGICGVLWVGAQDVGAAALTAGTLSSFLFYAIMVAASAGSFSEIMSDLQRASGAAERLRELLQTAPAIVSPTKPRIFSAHARGVVALHNINFAYPSNPEHMVLKNLTLSVSPGEKVAIVGPSGSGKSTILSLLLRFYDPQSGGIFVDGLNLKEVNVQNLRQRISYVPQDPVIFSGSLYENILYARPEANDHEVWDALEAAYLGDVVKALPKGIHTILGHRGVVLSGGQRQRIAIARAILRQGKLFLLDEATSALDAQSEAWVQESLKKMMLSRTTLVVAHRLATVLKADRILVLNNGTVEAMGTHAELISQDGLYRRLATLQFADALDLTKRSRAPHITTIHRKKE